MVGMWRGQYSSCPMIFEDEGYRSPSCRRPLLCVLKKPRAWKPPAIHVHVFQTFLSSEQCVVSFELILNLCSFVKNTHNSSLIAQRRLEDVKPVRANSRGFLNPWNNWQDKEIASGRRGTATLTTDSRLCRRRYYVIVKYRGLESPRLFMFTSSRRFSFIIHRSKRLKNADTRM